VRSLPRSLAPSGALLAYVVGALLGCVAFALPGAARAASSAEFLGVNLQPLQQNPAIAEDRWGSFLQPLADGQMRIHRIQADWSIMEPKAPVNGVHSWQWNAGGGGRNSMDWTIAQLASRGLRAVPTLNNSPSWARGGGSNLPDSSFSAFADFSIAYIQRYGPGGSFWAEHPELPQLPATHYELWNEANSSNFWTGKADAAAYARFLKVVYPKVKAAAPQATLMPSIGWPDAANYMAQLAANGAAADADAIAFHPYAPSADSMLKLVKALRATLGAFGRPDLPIYITESGQPANYSGTGKLHAYDGAVNDATRAATQALAAESLAHSDCGVNSFLVYAVTGSETNKEILSEGFMGILGYANAAPNATGLALQRASRRWAAAVASGSPTPSGHLQICGAGVTPPAALLPLTLQGSRGSSGGCVAGVVGFDGNPLEEADLVLTTPDGRVSRNGTNAAGKTESCVPDGPAIDSVDVYGELRNAARSPVLRCDIPVTRCAQIVAANQAAPAPCSVSLKVPTPRRDRRGVRSSARVKAKLVCDGYKSFRSVKLKVRLKGSTKSGKPRYRTVVVKRLIQPRFTVSYRVKGQKRERRLRSLTLPHGKTVSFTLHRSIRKGDELALVHLANPKKDALPRVRASVTLKKPLAPKRAKAKR
jgi:hypothetical protein